MSTSDEHTRASSSPPAAPTKAPPVAPGLSAEQEIEVTQEMAPPHLPVKVLSTPSMIQLIEMVCLQAVQEHLDSGQTTVGTHVDVSHTGPAMAGEKVRVVATLEEVVKRRLVFSVQVHSPREQISAGSHQRAIIDLSRFG